MGRLEGKTALVVGASRPDNMGQAIARRFLREGALVTVSGRGKADVQAFADETGCQAEVCDVSSKESVFRLVEAVVARHGRLDILVNAAATGQYGAFEETGEAELDEMLSIIFKGGFFLMQAAVGAMKTSGGGAIVNLSSQVATMMFENHAPYMGAKAGLEHVTRAVAYEFGQFGIRANIVAPGMTLTPMTRDMMVPGMAEAFVRETPLGRISTVDDIAAAVLFAASDECFMTGQTFHTTGGITLRRLPTVAEMSASVEAAAQ